MALTLTVTRNEDSQLVGGQFIDQYSSLVLILVSRLASTQVPFLLSNADALK